MRNNSDKTPVFQCQQCGECCAGKGGIYATRDEVAAMAGFLGLSEEDFLFHYVEESPMGPRLGTADGACVFVEDNRCRVHPVKPRICREWPFLAPLLQYPEELEYAKGACPGIDPDCSHEEFVSAVRGQGKP
ncbi:MAG: YkgJ family cysteine cluster protein [Deltaproteobacteria bacterium]|nr:YkgJ family cysteine cluster protein [Deltaproteobacteria bacterium]